MKIQTKKLANGFEIPVYGFGLWGVGGKREPDYSRDKEEIMVLKQAIDAGVTHFDTAESYAQGHSEELLGRAIDGYDRSKLFIATKVSGEHQAYKSLKTSFYASLKRLNTAYVDLYMLHSYPKTGIPIAETMRALDELVDEGVVKYIGVSNLSVNRFKEAQKYTKNKIVVNQLHYNVQMREIEQRELLEYCQKNDVMLVAWRPLQKNDIPTSAIIESMAKKYNKTQTQIIINWLISQDHVVTIAKTSSVKHLEENMGAIGWQMEVEDIEKIRSDFPRQETISDTYPLDYPADVPV